MQYEKTDHSYCIHLLSMVIENLNRQQLTAEDWKRTVFISDGKIGPRTRKLSAKEINILINNGRQAIKSYLN